MTLCSSPEFLGKANWDMKHKQYMQTQTVCTSKGQIWLEARAFDPKSPIFSVWFRDTARMEEMMEFEDERVSGGGDAKEHPAHCKRIERAVMMIGSLRLTF